MRAIVVGSYFLFAVVWGICPDATRSIGRSATYRRESRRWYLSRGHAPALQ
jgi:hypothetical protein